MNVFQKLQKNITQLEKSVEFAMEVLTQCSEKFKDLHTQMSEINTEATDWSTQYSVETAVSSSNNLSKEKSEDFDALLNMIGNIKSHALQAEKSINFSKNVLSCETSNKFEDLQLQVSEFKSFLEKLISNSQKSSDELLTSNMQKELEQTAFVATPTTSAKRKETPDIFEDRMKKHKNGDELRTVNPERTDISKASSSLDGIISSDLHSSKSRYVNAVDEAEVYRNENGEMGIDVLRIALQETEGILSSPDFHTFLILSEEVDDPVQLAKISFTKDIKMLHNQLVSFYHTLKNINDFIQTRKGESDTNRILERKLQILISVFKSQLSLT